MKKIKVGISGSLGRMGKELIKQIINDKRIQFVGGFDINDRDIFADEVFKKANVVIDFSSPSAIKKNLNLAISNRTALVIGTTGISSRVFSLIKNLRMC